eukprot:158351-Lingulodinium_polyedra.AAC.1
MKNHISKMRNEGTWATSLEITAASHLLLRPIHLITDADKDEESTTILEPPEIFAQSAWAPTVYLAHFLQWHFEGTAVRARVA